MTPTRLKQAARDDINQIIDFYLSNVGDEVALRFIEAWQQSLTPLARHPGVGSLRFEEQLRIPGHRVWAMHGFPHLVLYPVDAEGPEVQRVLRSARDLPFALQDSV
ncbi:hypothetical protein GCM10010873_11290 [Cypionkella aquatica]|uniref:Type II toxin-antitoxin system RelE/ParE family toxin n=1 Tax=Cypionkella aquatica TaxID=1756042 RepID=A0AA37U277_9RHOB|nr:type II toxin-antitoxin system RelE/ParE family toxin [Cypionkella aquatica]GLS86155.1 hypothetical protein GCM10010873_11290 [Cypionkella aquatica]